MRSTNVRVFFLVGAAKAGTTTVYHCLRQHPEIYIQPHKDVACYFCERHGLPLSFEEFERLLFDRRGDAAIVGDVCSDYLADPFAARKIARAFAAAKILIVLRNPADRAFSLYLWMIREGYEYLPSFGEALAAERLRLVRQLKDPALILLCKNDYLYFHSGLYSEQVRRYLEHFPREQILITLYDELRADPVAFMQRIYAFLGVRSNFISEIRSHNRSQYLWPVRYPYFCRRWLARVLPSTVVQFLIDLGPKRLLTRALDEGLRAELMARYAADIKRTAQFTGLKLGELWK